MRNIRIYQNTDLPIGKTITLDKAASNHLINVLRLTVNSPITLFNGRGGEYAAHITDTKKHALAVLIDKFIDIDRESPLHLHLGQALAKGDKMDWILQKATELGITEITPLLTEHCDVRLSKERQEKRMNHWQKIIISACEQCGRNTLPTLNKITSIEHWLENDNSELKLLLNPAATKHIKAFQKSISSIALLIGPEGGLSDTEIKLAEQQQFQSLSLGPRILRTETAAIAAIAIVQNL